MKLGALESRALMIWLNVNENGGFRNCRTDFADDERQRSPISAVAACGILG
jgi:hypothetical protein